jgi:ABC-type antimicrobial peptide transport system permease subunit
VANLLLARGASRDREISVRVALGAGRARIFGHVLLESVVLAMAGGLLGSLLTPWGVRLFMLAYPSDLPFYFSLDVDGWSLLLVASLVVSTAILMGVIPLLRAAAADFAPALREGSRSRSGIGAIARGALVISELAR